MNAGEKKTIDNELKNLSLHQGTSMVPVKHKKVNMLPDRDSPHIKRVISILNIAEPALYVDIMPDSKATVGQCFINVLEKVKHDKGEMVLGWRFCEYAYMIEAEFHAVWQSPESILVDITPEEFSLEKKILFSMDHNKKFEGSRTDNFRLNITTNELVDDIIEIERAKFRFTDKAQNVDNNGEVLMNEAEEELYRKLYFYSHNLENLLSRNKTIDSTCFCESDRKYKNCHRRPILEFLRNV